MELTGTKIADRYEIMELVSDEGMSYIYKGIDLETNEPVAAKFLKPEFVSGRLEHIIRFQKVIDTLSKINHPNIVRFFGLYSTDGHMAPPMHCVIMELISGTKLQESAREKNFSVDEVCEIVCQTCRALVKVHNAGIIHGDIKPGNILLAEGKESKENIQVKLIDFGLSDIKRIKEDKQDFGISGTYLYMPPEQAGIIRRNVDERSDLYSLGVVFYELLTGWLPFTGEILVKLLHEQAAKIPDAPSQKNTAIPEILNNMVLRLLEKEPERRYQTAAGFLHDLELYLSGEREFNIGQADSRSRVDFTGKMAGRETEVSRMLELFEDAKGGKGRLCFIAGEAGIGKTRLMEEFRNHIFAAGGTYIEGRAKNRESKTPHHPFHQTLSDYMRRFRHYGKEQQKKIAGAVQKNCRNLGRIIMDFYPPAESILGECPEIVPLQQEREVQRFYITLSKFFFCLAEAEKGLVLLLDDLHWSDTGSLRLLEEMLRDIEDKPILIICSFRESELAADHPLQKIMSENRDGRIEKITLANLDTGSIRTFINSNIKMNEEDSIPASDFILSKAGGNPLFTQEIIKELIAEGVLIIKEGVYKLDRKGLSAIEIPKTILDTLLKRLQILSQEEMSFLTRASVIGKTSDIDLLMGIESKTIGKKDLDEGHFHRIIGIIDRAVEMQMLVKETGGKYSFSHDRVRDAFYEKISSRERKRLHGLLGSFLEEAAGENKDALIYDLAHHFIEAGDEEKMLEYAYPAAMKARRNYSHGDAIKYFKTAREILQKYLNTGDEKFRKQWIECTRNLGETLRIAGPPDDEAINLFHELLPFMKTNKERALINLQITMACVKIGDFISLEPYARNGLALIGEKLPLSIRAVRIHIIKESLIFIIQSIFPFLFTAKKPKDPEKYHIIIGFYDCLFWVYFVLGNILKLTMVVQRMLNISKSKTGLSRELGVSMMYYSAVLCMCARFPVVAINIKKRSYDFIEKSYAILSNMGDEWDILRWHWIKIFSYMHTAEYSLALEDCDIAIELGKRLGDVLGLKLLYHEKFLICYYLDSYKEANNNYNILKKYVTDFAEEISFNIYGYPLGYYIISGDFDEAEKKLLKYISICSERNLLYWQCVFYIDLGYLYTEKGNVDKAFLYLEKAQTLIKNNQFIPYVINRFYVRYAHLLIQDYLSRQKELSIKELIKYRKKIKRACFRALRKIKKWPRQYCIPLRIMGNCYELSNNRKKAQLYYNKSIVLCAKICMRYNLALTLYNYGAFLRHSGDKQGAWEKLTSAYLLFEEIGITLYREKIAALLGLSADIGKAGENAVFRERMQYMIDKSRDFAFLQNLPEVLDSVLSLAMELSGARNGYLFLIDDEEGKLKTACEKHVDSAEAGDYSWNIVNNVYENGKLVIAADAGSDETFSLYRSVAGQKLKSVICLPVSHNEIVSGVCYLDNPLTGSVFAEEEERLISMMLANAAIMIENIILHNRLKDKENKRKERLSAPDKKYLEKAFEYIRQHYSEDMQREGIADALSINPNYLGRLFKSNTGKTIQEYVNDVRIEEAAEQLANGSGKIIDIAMDIGFDSIRTFNRVFYRVMGITPSEYREKIARK